MSKSLCPSWREMLTCPLRRQFHRPYRRRLPERRSTWHCLRYPPNGSGCAGANHNFAGRLFCTKCIRKVSGRCALANAFSGLNAGWSCGRIPDTYEVILPGEVFGEQPAFVIGRSLCRSHRTWTASLSSECNCNSQIIYHVNYVTMNSFFFSIFYLWYIFETNKFALNLWNDSKYKKKSIDCKLKYWCSKIKEWLSLPVITKMILSSEGLAADVARIGSFIRVRPFVYQQIIRFGKLAVTELADELLLGPGRPSGSAE